MKAGGGVGLFQGRAIWEFGIFFIEIPIFFHACHFQGFGWAGATKIPKKIPLKTPKKIPENKNKNKQFPKNLKFPPKLKENREHTTHRDRKVTSSKPIPKNPTFPKNQRLVTIYKEGIPKVGKRGWKWQHSQKKKTTKQPTEQGTTATPGRRPG